ncbi:MAG: ParB/RepB/Spo0J family partition protein [Thermoguttaceae bacterium]
MPNKDDINIRSMKDRVYESIPVADIVVLNPRNREQLQFKENVRSIDKLGMYKPICVNKRNYPKRKKYELVCGQGRLEAHQALKKTHIMAEVIDVASPEAYLYSIIENLARSRPGTIEFAKSLLQMFDEGVPVLVLCDITGKCESYITDYIRLVKNGEERLIKGVEDGIIPITLAKQIASGTSSVQELLIDACDEQLVTSNNIGTVKRLVEKRAKERSKGKYKSVDELKNDIEEMTGQKNQYCQQVQKKESRLARLVAVFDELEKDKEFCKLLAEFGITLQLDLKTRPKP